MSKILVEKIEQIINDRFYAVKANFHQRFYANISITVFLFEVFLNIIKANL